MECLFAMVKIGNWNFWEDIPCFSGIGIVKFSLWINLGKKQENIEKGGDLVHACCRKTTEDCRNRK